MKTDFRQEGYRLLQDGLNELARVEANGIRIDVPRLHKTQEDLLRRVRALRQRLLQDRLWTAWRRRFGEKSNLGSLVQLGQVLHKDLKFPVSDRTVTGRPKMDEESLQKIDHPFVQDYSQMLKYEKARGTFLRGIEKEVVDGRLHPSFSLHTARSFRSSSSDPNFQNFPVRDKEISQIIRSLFIASPQSVLVENDFKGIEVALSAAYHHDPEFISYITTPGKDMHRDMAAQIYCLDAGEVSKDIRYGAKNKFVFPEFYGDFYISCARALWDWIRKGKLKGPDGKSLYRHLKREGIVELGLCDPESPPRAGTFEAHLKRVENDFWNHRFRVYGRWKRDWYEAYLHKGYFDMLTGFRIAGFFSRNQVTNLPIQGSAFHCLLWSLIQINRRLRTYRLKSLVVGQIHDSMLGDVREKELRDYLEIVEETVARLPKHWPWLIVAPEIENEICPPGTNWFRKREFRFHQGRFYHPLHPGKSTPGAQKFLRVLEKMKYE